MNDNSDKVGRGGRRKVNPLLLLGGVEETNPTGDGGGVSVSGGVDGLVVVTDFGSTKKMGNNFRPTLNINENENKDKGSLVGEGDTPPTNNNNTTVGGEGEVNSAGQTAHVPPAFITPVTETVKPLPLFTDKTPEETTTNSTGGVGRKRPDMGDLYGDDDSSMSNTSFVLPTDVVPARRAVNFGENKKKISNPTKETKPELVETEPTAEKNEDDTDIIKRNELLTITGEQIIPVKFTPVLDTTQKVDRNTILEQLNLTKTGTDGISSETVFGTTPTHTEPELEPESGRGEEHKPFTVKENPKPRAQYSRKIDDNIIVDDWGDNTDEGTHYGLGGEIDNTYVKPQYAKGFHLTERDIIIMRFLARYRYAYVNQIARLVDSTPRIIVARMRVLEKRGFLRKEPITDKQYLWTTRKAGNVLADISFPEIKKGSISYATIAHTIGLGNLGVEFEREAGGKDLLGEGKGNPDWVMPKNRYKLSEWGDPNYKTFGEITVTEREIRQGQLRWRGNQSTKDMRDLVTRAAKDTQYAAELEEGNEGLFVIYGAGGKGGEHIPDMVVARERTPEGTPQHIAIELELTGKSNADWRRILRNYRDNGEMYSKVYYFTHKRSISTALTRMAAEVGMENKFMVRKYMPSNSNMPFWG